MPENINGWAEWSKYVLKELERLNDCYKSLDTRVSRVEQEVAVIRMKLEGAVTRIDDIPNSVGSVQKLVAEIKANYQETTQSIATHDVKIRDMNIAMKWLFGIISALVVAMVLEFVHAKVTGRI